MNKREIINRIDFLVSSIAAFAQEYKLTNAQAYSYLSRFTGIDFLIDCYEAQHTLSIEDTVADLQQLCYNHGGRIE